MLFVIANIFTVRYVKIGAAAGALGVTALWLTRTVAGVVICLPVSARWDPEAVSGWCGARQSVLYGVVSGVNSVTDFYVCLLPVPCIWSLGIPARRKWGLIAMFSVGFL